MDDSQNGTTARAHIERLMTDVESSVAEVFARVRLDRRLRPQDREAMSRRLAGVVGACETMRIWLGAGAP